MLEQTTDTYYIDTARQVRGAAHAHTHTLLSTAKGNSKG